MTDRSSATDESQEIRLTKEEAYTVWNALDFYWEWVAEVAEESNLEAQREKTPMAKATAKHYAEDRNQTLELMQRVGSFLEPERYNGVRGVG